MTFPTRQDATLDQTAEFGQKRTLITQQELASLFVHMQLLDAIFLAAQMSDDSVICARAPFHQTSDAVIVQIKEGSSIPHEVKAEGYAYFLETTGVNDLLEMVGKKRSSRETKVEFVCYYASWDAYPAWYFDLDDV